MLYKRTRTYIRTSFNAMIYTGRSSSVRHRRHIACGMLLCCRPARRRRPRPSRPCRRRRRRAARDRGPRPVAYPGQRGIKGVITSRISLENIERKKKNPTYRRISISAHGTLYLKCQKNVMSGPTALREYLRRCLFHLTDKNINEYT